MTNSNFEVIPLPFPARQSQLPYFAAVTVAFWISTAAHPVPPDMQSGLHFCFTAPTPKSVDAFHAAARRQRTG